MNDLGETISKIDGLLNREEHDAGYEAFVHMRKIWPQLRSLPDEIERLRAQLTEWQDDYAALKKSRATDLNDALSHLRAGIDKLRPMACETPIELHKACHALTHIVAQAKEAPSE